jgi:hypothetical protein
MDNMIFCVPFIEIDFHISKNTTDIGLMSIVDVQSLLTHFKFKYALKFGMQPNNTEASNNILYIVAYPNNPQHVSSPTAYKEYIGTIMAIREFIISTYPYIQSTVTCRYYGFITTQERSIVINKMISKDHARLDVAYSNTNITTIKHDAYIVIMAPITIPMYINDFYTNTTIKGDYNIQMATVLRTEGIDGGYSRLRRITKYDKYLHKKELAYYKLLITQCNKPHTLMHLGTKQLTTLANTILQQRIMG